MAAALGATAQDSNSWCSQHDPFASGAVAKVPNAFPGNSGDCARGPPPPQEDSDTDKQRGKLGAHAEGPWRQDEEAPSVVAARRASEEAARTPSQACSAHEGEGRETCCTAYGEARAARGGRGASDLNQEETKAVRLGRRSPSDRRGRGRPPRRCDDAAQGQRGCGTHSDRAACDGGDPRQKRSLREWIVSAVVCGPLRTDICRGPRQSRPTARVGSRGAFLAGVRRHRAAPGPSCSALSQDRVQSI